MQPGRNGAYLHSSSVYADMSLYIVQISFFFLPFNKNLGWCRCGQHYIWWDNSTSHSSWKGLNKIGSSSQSSRYGKRSLLKTFLSQWQFTLEGWKQKTMYQWTCLMGGGSQMLKARRPEFPQKVLLWGAILIILQHHLMARKANCVGKKKSLEDFGKLSYVLWLL